MSLALAYLRRQPAPVWPWLASRLIHLSDPVANATAPEAVSKEALSDEELVGLLASKGDMECLGLLYDRHGKRVLNRAWGMVGERSLAEDLVHDVFLKLFLKASKYRPESTFISWFNVLSYNVIIDELRRRKRMRVVELDEDRWQGPTYDDGAEDRQEKVLFELRVDRLKELLAMLREDERALLIMKYQDGISVEEMAGFFGIGVSAVKMRLMRTREKVIKLDQGSMPYGT